MKFIHRIVFKPDKTQRRVLQELGISVPPYNDLFVFEFDEKDEKLISLKPYIDKWQLVDNIRTEFTKKELDSASFLIWFPLWLNGYPMPDEDFGYIGTTYQKQGYCKVCGSGLLQQSPFRLRKSPKWGSKKIFGLNWVFDEVFVRKDGLPRACGLRRVRRAAGGAVKVSGYTRGNIWYNIFPKENHGRSYRGNEEAQRGAPDCARGAERV